MDFRRFLRPAVVGWLASVMLVSAASSGSAEFEAGLAAYKQGRFEAAYEAWRPLAEAGEMEAQFGLGQLYHWGRGVSVDIETARLWYRRAGAQGHGIALYTLGFIAFTGKGAEGHDMDAAVAWWRKGAAAGDPLAMVSLGNAYEDGSSVRQDLVEAYKWNTLGVRYNGGSPPLAAQQNLARLADQMTQAQIQEAKNLAASWTP